MLAVTVAALRRPRRNARFFAWLGAGVLLGGAYHVKNFDTLERLFLRSTDPGATSLGQEGYVPPPLLEKVRGLLELELGATVWQVALAVGLVAALVLTRRRHVLLWTWVLGRPALLLFVIRVTMPYYFHPVMPVFALVSVS